MKLILRTWSGSRVAPDGRDRAAQGMTRFRRSAERGGNAEEAAWRRQRGGGNVIDAFRCHDAGPRIGDVVLDVRSPSLAVAAEPDWIGLNGPLLDLRWRQSLLPRLRRQTGAMAGMVTL